MVFRRMCEISYPQHLTISRDYYIVVEIGNDKTREIIVVDKILC
jgi:hypothetical protein